MHHDVALSRLAVGVLGSTGGLVGVARHLPARSLPSRAWQWRPDQSRALALDTGAGLLGHRGQLLRRTGQLAGDGADPADQVAQAAAGALQRIEQLTELVAARLPRLLGHIACADALGNAYRTGQRLRQLTHDQPADDQPGAIASSVMASSKAFFSPASALRRSVCDCTISLVLR